MKWAGLIGNSQSSLASSAARAHTHIHMAESTALKGHGIMDTVIWLADAKGQLVLNF